MRTSPSAWCHTSALFQVACLFVRCLVRVLVAGLALALALARELELALELALPSAGAALRLGLVLLLPWEQSQVARTLACPAHRRRLSQSHEIP